jgi:hypothetical protein
VKLQAGARMAFGVLLLACGGYTFVNKEAGAIAVELVIVVWTTGRILVEALEALLETGKK